MIVLEIFKDVTSPVIHFSSRLLDKGVLEVSLILATIIHFLGLDLYISQFILILVVLDLITKIYSLVVSKYGSFSFKNLRKAFNEGIINSYRFRRGIYGKVVMYLLLIFVASSIAREDIVDKVILSSWISQFIYSALVVSELLSILENYRDSGYSIAGSLLKMISRKSSKYFEDLGDNLLKDDTKSKEVSNTSKVDSNTKP